MSKKIIIATIITILIVAIGFFGSFWAGKSIKDFIRLALAGSEHNVSGWAWSENAGWISMNSTNCSPGGDGHPDALIGSDTKLLIHADGDGQSFVDSSSSAHPITATNVTQSSSQSVAGGKSAHFNGDPAYLQMPDSEDWNFGDKYFTIDFWVYFKDFNGTAHQEPYLMGQSNGGTAGWHCNMSWDLIYSNFTHQLGFQWYPTGCVGVYGNWQHEGYHFPWNAETGKWYHVVLAKNNNELRTFVNCQQIGETQTITSTPFNSSRPFRVGWVEAYWYSNWLSGYIDELRITKGATSGYSLPEYINYGVHINNISGALSGYGWSENVGWIKFDPVGPYPSSPSQAAQVDGSGNLTGWARACAGAANTDCSGGTNPLAGGWDGWIKLSNATINFVSSPAEFHGYAWGSDVVGWASFNCAEGGASGGNICNQSNYKVITTYDNSGPKVGTLSVIPFDQCSPPAKYQFSWTYLGSAGTFDHAQLQIDDKSNFSDCESGSGCEINRTITSTSLGIPLGSPAVQDVSLAYNKTYYWRVKVWDSYGRSSDWVKYDSNGDGSADSFVTPAHSYPDIATAGFSWSPAKPAQNEEVSFANNGKCYGTGNTETACAWSWTIPGATYVAPSNSAAKEPVVKFNSLGDKSISARATDADGLWCEANKSLKVSVKLPKWKEITPF